MATTYEMGISIIRSTFLKEAGATSTLIEIVTLVLLLVVLCGIDIACTCCDNAATIACGSDKKGHDEHNELIYDIRWRRS